MFYQIVILIILIINFNKKTGVFTLTSTKDEVKALEKSIFTQFFTNTIKTLESSKDYPTYDSRNKLLSFYFTFFENLTANRSYVVYALDEGKNQLENLKKLLNNQLGETLPLLQSSLIRSYLPPNKQFDLLNKESQEYMSMSTMSYIRSKISGFILSFLKNAWIWPVPSLNIRKQIAPLPRIVSAYPAMLTSVSSNAEPLLTICPIVCVR